MRWDWASVRRHEVGSPGVFTRLSWWLAFVWLVAGDALAAGGKPAKKLVNVADTRALEPGMAKWFGDVYNSSLLLYGLLVVAVMVTMGAVLGFGIDRLMGLLGINLGKMEHHE